MLTEVTGGGVESLVLLPSSRLEVLRAAGHVRALIENYVWRTAIVVGVATMATIYLRDPRLVRRD